ncbi:MAG TPA: hypothetical protein VFE33_01000 [Thermoanaerobaculia bacterium]|nr:hypothetical protein [Thermoanaerobaculia bacterium]
MTEVTQVRKTYETPFVLNADKLTRILGIIQDRLAEHSDSSPPTFDVTMRDDKRISLTGAQQLLALDNLVANPIVALDIKAGSYPLPHRVSIDFGSGYRRHIALSVASPDHRWATHVFGELDEQIERTATPTWAHKIKDSPLPPIILGIFAGLLVTTLLVTGGASSPPPPLTPQQAQELLQRVQHARTDTEKLDLLLEPRVRELENLTKGARPARPLPVVRILFLALPVLLLAGVAWYTLLFCYPRSVFAWGDMQTHYQALVSRRRGLWALVILALATGILGNLFVASLPALR